MSPTYYYVTMLPVIRYAIAFVLLSIVIQWIANSINRTGPIDFIEIQIFPHIVRTLGVTYNYGNDIKHNNDYNYGMICPPDKWIDPAFVVEEDDSGRNDNGSNGGDSLYSEKFDPRNNFAMMQSFFPHCALQRWVELGGRGSNSCPDGEVHVTVIQAPTSGNYRHNGKINVVNTGGGGEDDDDDDDDDEGSNTDTEHEDKETESRIPKIIHISSPTNCLPTSTLRALSHIVESASVPRTQSQKLPPIHRHHHHHIIESQQLVIYIHSQQAMQNYLLTKEFPTFPEVKEGVLCGMGKIKAASHRAVVQLLGGGKNEEEVEDVVEEDVRRRRNQRIVDEIAFGVQTDIWQYLILWEYGGITMDISTLHAILVESDDNISSSNLDNLKNAVNLTTATDSGDARLQKLMTQWWRVNETTSDALLYFISNYFEDGRSSKERIPLTTILGAAPRHPFIYFAAKSALRYAIWDEEKSFIKTGRTTQIPPIKDGLGYVNRNWELVKTGDVVNVLGYDMERKNSIQLLNGNDVLPTSLTSPNRTPWKSIFDAFAAPRTIDSGNGRRESNITNVLDNNTNLPSEADIMEVMQRIASEQTYFSTKSLFSCMEYRLDMYMHKK